MNTSEILKTVFNSLRTNKVRSILTMLGVIIGVFAVISLVSVGSGVEKFVSNSFNSIGSNLLLVAPGKVDFSDDPAKTFTRNKLDEKHVELIDIYLKDKIVAVSPSIRLSSKAKYKTESHQATVVGGNYNYINIFDLVMEKGQFFSKNDEKTKAYVLILGANIKRKLFGSTDALGKYVVLGDENYEVIGVMGEKNQRFDDAIVVPYTSAVRTFDLKNFSGIAIKVKADENINLVLKQVELALLRDLKNTEFSVLSQADILKSITNILSVLTAGIGAIAGISLFVGGIGIMNIMLVSVTERTAEIGLRKALGATPRDIALQFVLEAISLSVIGGTIGILLSFILSLAVKSLIELVISTWSIVIAFGFSVFVGLLFGSYPAINASKKDPIESLRYE
ncbi:ABC transporter permease [candidate division WWE3 bacterium]|nr:ABC transporter permease [candidate division WWE3 bacterium]